MSRQLVPPVTHHESDNTWLIYIQQNPSTEHVLGCHGKVPIAIKVSKCLSSMLVFITLYWRLFCSPPLGWPLCKISGPHLFLVISASSQMPGKIPGYRRDSVNVYRLKRTLKSRDWRAQLTHFIDGNMWSREMKAYTHEVVGWTKRQEPW